MATGSRWCSAANSCPTSRTDSVIRPGQATRPARRLRSRSSSSIRAAQRCGAGRTRRTGADNRPSCSTGRLAYARFRNCSLLGIVTFVRWCDEEIKIALSRSSFSRWRYQLRRALVFPLSVTGQGTVHRAPCTIREEVRSDAVSPICATSLCSQQHGGASGAAARLRRSFFSRPRTKRESGRHLSTASRAHSPAVW
ncbi:hypothetical protein OKW45_004174 [Paraburkholderia sp. WSM4175]